MKLKVTRTRLRIGRGESGEADLDDLGFAPENMASSPQFVTLPINEQSIEVITSVAVFDEDELERREQMKADVNDELLSGLVDDEEDDEDDV